MSGHVAFNAYLFHMRLMECSECANSIKERKMIMPGTHCSVLAFQLYQEDVLTTLQEMDEEPLTPDSLVPIMLWSAKG